MRMLDIPNTCVAPPKLSTREEANDECCKLNHSLVLVVSQILSP